MGFRYPSGVSLEQHRLDGRSVRTPPSASTDSDLEALRLADGDFLTTGYALRKHVVVSATGDTAPVLNGTFAEIRPDGTSAFTWDVASQLSVAESHHWWFAWGCLSPIDDGGMGPAAHRLGGPGRRRLPRLDAQYRRDLSHQTQRPDDRVEAGVEPPPQRV